MEGHELGGVVGVLLHGVVVGLQRAAVDALLALPVVAPGGMACEGRRGMEVGDGGGGWRWEMEGGREWNKKSGRMGKKIWAMTTMPQQF